MPNYRGNVPVITFNKIAAPNRKMYKSTVRWHWNSSALLCGGHLKDTFNFSCFVGQSGWRKAGSQAVSLGPSMLSGLLRAISYGNQRGRMQSIAKQVTLAPTAPHKTVKTRGYLAVTLEWRLKRRLNRGENKAAVQIWGIVNTSLGRRLNKSGNHKHGCCCSAVSHGTTCFPSSLRSSLVYWGQNFILCVCNLDRGSCRKEKICSVSVPTMLLLLLQWNWLTTTPEPTCAAGLSIVEDVLTVWARGASTKPRHSFIF